MGKSIKYEMASMNRGAKEWQRETGESVLWFEFDPSQSSAHPIYDEGPNRMWYPPVRLPVMFFDFHQDDPVRAEEGLYTVSTATFTFMTSIAWDLFKIPPVNTGAHFKDRFAYGNPMTSFTVTKYEKQGFLHGRYLTTSVRGEQLKEEEFFNDVQFRDYFGQGGSLAQ